MAGSRFENARWNTDIARQGRIVQVSFVQVAGEAEGPASGAERIRLITDASDRSWELFSDGRRVAHGKAETTPTCADAVRMCRMPEVAHG